MRNCRDEFLEEIYGKEVLCAYIRSEKTCWGEDRNKSALLKIGFSKEDFNLFLESLNYDYDDGYGGQEVFGNIWYKDGTWSERGEYDGSEWWEYKSAPSIPDNLK